MSVQARIIPVLVISFSLLSSSATLACSFPAETSTAVPMDDGDHVFVMQINDGDLEPYPTSGLYSKDAPQVPVWRWQEPYLNNMVTRIYSYAGRFVVAVYQTEGDLPALRVYDRGKLARAFPLEVFLSDKTAFAREPLSICSNVAWYREIRDIRFDGKGSRLIAESIDGQIVTVDVESGEILDRQQINLLPIEVIAKLIDGTQVRIRDVGKCGPVDLVRVRYQGGLADVPAISGLLYILKDDGTKELWTERVVELHKVRTVERVSDVRDYYIDFRIYLKDGTTLSYGTIGPSTTERENLCGSDISGARVSVTLNEIRAFSVHEQETADVK